MAVVHERTEHVCGLPAEQAASASPRTPPPPACTPHPRDPRPRLRLDRRRRPPLRHLGPRPGRRSPRAQPRRRRRALTVTDVAEPSARSPRSSARLGRARRGAPRRGRRVRAVRPRRRAHARGRRRAAGACRGRRRNNQLASRDVAGLLTERRIVWAPDFVVNAGGVIYLDSRASPAPTRPPSTPASRASATPWHPCCAPPRSTAPRPSRPPSGSPAHASTPRADGRHRPLGSCHDVPRRHAPARPCPVPAGADPGAAGAGGGGSAGAVAGIAMVVGGVRVLHRQRAVAAGLHPAVRALRARRATSCGCCSPSRTPSVRPGRGSSRWSAGFTSACLAALIATTFTASGAGNPFSGPLFLFVVGSLVSLNLVFILAVIAAEVFVAPKVLRGIMAYAPRRAPRRMALGASPPRTSMRPSSPSSSASGRQGARRRAVGGLLRRARGRGLGDARGRRGARARRFGVRRGHRRAVRRPRGDHEPGRRIAPARDRGPSSAPSGARSRLTARIDCPAPSTAATCSRSTPPCTSAPPAARTPTASRQLRGHAATPHGHPCRGAADQGAAPEAAMTALPDGTIIGDPRSSTCRASSRASSRCPSPRASRSSSSRPTAAHVVVGAPKTAEMLAGLGYRVVTVDIGEFEKLEGCVTCLSVRVR